MDGVTGLRALVTGGGSGIGLAAARRLADDGALVTICGRTEAKLEAAADSIGHGARWVVADVTIEADVERAVAAAAEPRGRLDIAFANAGGSYHMGSITDADAGAVRATVEVNLVGTFLTVKHAARAMTAGGSIVGMSSGAGHFPHRFLPAYGAAKAGVEMLCKYAAEELGDRGIRVNCVQPGIIDDELMAPITAGGPLLDDYLREIPVGRVGTVDDVAALVRFLAGPESAWLSGACVPVDGGHHLRRGANYQLLFGG
jgi:NAD(P)-dependent dehydrogenase (short-subunit alcohol dehydrogenase family)